MTGHLFGGFCLLLSYLHLPCTASVSAFSYHIFIFPALLRFLPSPFFSSFSLHFTGVQLFQYTDGSFNAADVIHPQAEPLLLLPHPE